MECLLLVESSKALVELCGLSILERCLRSLQLCGITRAHILSDDESVVAAHLARHSPHRAKIECLFSAPPHDARPCLVLRGDHVFDPRLLVWLLEQNRPAALIDSDAPERICGAAFVTPDAITGSSFDQVLRHGLERDEIAALEIAGRSWYSPDLRRDLRPFWFSAPLPSEKKRAENALLDAAQKGTLDLPALVHAPIETFLVSQLCKFPVTPNQLTIFCNLVAWFATFLFATGHLGTGIAVALAVGVLDGLDGKLARVKLEVSKVGELEHFFDLLFENSWWIAFAFYLQSASKLPGAYRYLLFLLSAEVLAKLARNRIERSSGKAIGELGRFERIVRLVGARRNVDVWILALGILWQNPARAFVVVAWWEAITTAAHLPRAVRTLWRGRSSAPHKR